MISKSLRWIIVPGLLLFMQAWVPYASSKNGPPGIGNDLRTILSGRFVMVNSKCAGFNFINKKVVLWTNEVSCNDPDTLLIRWLDNKTFMTKSIRRYNEHCPPSIDLYRVMSFDGRLLTLKRIWTGWNKLEDDVDSQDYKLQLIKKA
jgi:hypothetical protein